jgi:hypothetical protein
MKTAVVWYAEQMQSKEQFTQDEFDSIYQQAKEMEKQQIIDAYADGVKETKSRCEYDNAKEYYNETFNK